MQRRELLAKLSPAVLFSNEARWLHIRRGCCIEVQMRKVNIEIDLRAGGASGSASGRTTTDVKAAYNSKGWPS